MPQIIRTVDQIMHEEQRDMFFVHFDPERMLPRRQSEWRTKHLAWFDAHRLRYELAAPPGLLSGDPGIYAVHFTGQTDPLLADYTAEFENPDGTSLHPKQYRAFIVTYAGWLENHPNWQGEPDWEC